jgi:hypothetical protein
MPTQTKPNKETEPELDRWYFPRGDYLELANQHALDVYEKLDPKIRHCYYDPAWEWKSPSGGRESEGYSRSAVKERLVRGLRKSLFRFVAPAFLEGSDLGYSLESLIEDFLAAGVLFMNCTSKQISRYFPHEITLDAFRKLSNR